MTIQQDLRNLKVLTALIRNTVLTGLNILIVNCFKSKPNLEYQHNNDNYYDSEIDDKSLKYWIIQLIITHICIIIIASVT